MTDAPDAGELLRRLPPMQLDLLTAIQRLEQIRDEPHMAEFLLDRVLTCDLPRLRQHLSRDALAAQAALWDEIEGR